MGFKSSKKKIRKYIERDDFSRLKSYLHKHRDIDINKMKFDGGDTALHLACRLGQDHAVWYLLRRGADPLLCNDHDEVALHCACRYTLEESHYGYFDLVQPLIEKCPKALYIEDKDHHTPQDLVRHIRRKLTEKGANIVEDESSSDSSEESWSDRLAKEMQDEYTESWGAYEKDFTDYPDSAEKETFADWGERMRREMDAKRREQREQALSRSAKRRRVHEKQSTEEEEKEEARRKAEFQQRLKREHADYQRRAAQMRGSRLRQRKAEYEARCLRLFKPLSDSAGGSSEADSLSYRDIPWPTPANWNKEVDSLKEFLLCDINSAAEAEAAKKYLREQQVRWHPDRFTQRMGSRLKESERDRILSRVNFISQLMNNIISGLDT